MLDDPEMPSSGPEGDPSSEGSSGGTRGKLRDMAQTALQSVADRSIELMKQGRWDELDPKMQEVLATGFDTVRGATPNTEGNEPAQIPADTARYAQIGKQTVAAQNLAKIEGTVRQQVLQENWVSEARELFAEFGDVDIDIKDWQAVDPTNFRKFPQTEAGYREWRKAVNTFKKTQYSATSEPSAEQTGGVDADRQAAGSRVRTPQPRATATGQSTELQKAKAAIEGKNIDEYRESLKARIP